MTTQATPKQIESAMVSAGFKIDEGANLPWVVATGSKQITGVAGRSTQQNLLVTTPDANFKPQPVPVVVFNTGSAQEDLLVLIEVMKHLKTAPPTYPVKLKAILNGLKLRPEMGDGKVTDLVTPDGAALGSQDLAKLGLDPSDLGCLDEHPEGSDRGGFVPFVRRLDGATAYFMEQEGEWR